MAVPKPPAKQLQLANGALRKNPRNRTAAEKRAIRLTKAWRDQQKRGARPGTGSRQIPTVPGTPAGTAEEPQDFFAGLNLGTPPTAGQFQQQAQQMAQASLQPSMQEIARLQEQAIRQAQGRADLAGGLAQALGPMVGQIGPAIQQQYQQAAQQQGQLAQGFSSDLAQIGQAEADANAALLQNVAGAPAEQIQQTQQQSSGAADPLYGTGGFIPATAMGREGAAMAAYGSTMPGVVARMGQQDAASALHAGQVQSADLQRQAADLQAQLPGLTQQMAMDLLQQAQAQYEDNRAFQLQLAGARQDQYNTNREFKMAEQEFKQAKAEANRQFQLQKQAARAAAKAAGVDMKKWNREMALQEAQFKADLAGQDFDQWLATQNLALDQMGAVSGGGLTPYQRANRADKAATAKAKAKSALAETLREQAEKLVIYRQGLQPGSKKRDRGKTPPYAEAAARLREIYSVEIRALRKRGVKQSTINQMIRGALIAAGWKPPKPKPKPGVQSGVNAIANAFKF